jgi:hypothetical protein
MVNSYDSKSRVILQIVMSITIIIYGRNMFIVLATGFTRRDVQKYLFSGFFVEFVARYNVAPNLNHKYSIKFANRYLLDWAGFSGLYFRRGSFCS